MNATDATDATRVVGRVFTEQPKRHRLNRMLARTTRVEPAVMSNGEHGVAVRYGDQLLVLTEAEAFELTNAITDVMEGA